MYYTRESLLMIEELQLVPEYQRTLLCYKTVKYLCEFLGEKIHRIEAYALKSNKISIGLMQDLGFAKINDTLGTKFLHFFRSFKGFLFLGLGGLSSTKKIKYLMKMNVNIMKIIQVVPIVNI